MSAANQSIIALLLSDAATALNAHLVSAAVGQTSAAISNIGVDPVVDFIHASCQNGVLGTDPNARPSLASTDSASDILQTSGAAVNLQIANRGRAVAQLEEQMLFA